MSKMQRGQWTNYLWSIPLFFVLVACSEKDKQIRISLREGPFVFIHEGAIHTIGIELAEIPQSGPCSTPHRAEQFRIEVDESTRSMFRVLQLTGHQGIVELEVEPKCDIVPKGGRDILVEVDIVSVEQCADATTVRLQIADAARANSPTDPLCPPIARAWTGDCSSAPPDSSPAVAIPPQTETATLCIDIASQDPHRDRLWLKRLKTQLPVYILHPTQLGKIENAPGSHRYALQLRNLAHVGGEFSIDYDVALGDPGEGLPDFSGQITLVIGTPGLSISIPTQPNQPTIPESINEFSAVSAILRLWNFDSPDPNPTCIRATREGKTTNSDRRIRLTNRDSDQQVQENEWLCGRLFSIRFSAPINAPEVEQLHLEAGHCHDCDGTPEVKEILTTRSLDIPVVSLAEELHCDTNGDNSELLTACANLVGDPTPEIVFVATNNESPRMCSWLGNSLPRAGERKDTRHIPANFSQQSNEVPQSLTSLTRRQIHGSGGIPMILGQFNTPPHTRMLTMTEGSPPIANWVAAEGVAGVNTNLATSVPLAPDRGSATHLASPDGNSIQITCLATGITDPSTCQTIHLADVAPADHTLVDLARADMNGDRVNDLIAFTVQNAPFSRLTIVIMELQWPTPAHPEQQNRQEITTDLTGTLFPFAKRRVKNCNLPCSDNLLFLSRTETNTPALLHRLRTAPTFGLVTVDTLHASYGLVTQNQHALVAMRFQVAEAIINEDTTQWARIDPVLIEENSKGLFRDPPPGYGEHISGCNGSRGGIVFTTSTSSARYSQLDIDVRPP